MIENKDINLTVDELRNFYPVYFSYYKTLNSAAQELFVKRCLEFIKEKIITGAEGFEPNNKVKAIIAASAVQLTLGLDTWTLNYFDTIIIHPGDFDDKPSGLKFKGETNLRGYIRLSWAGFIAGYKNETDNINLGLHEFTHALRFNSITGFEQDYFVEHYFDAWLASADEPFNDIKQNKKTIFRKYGGANLNEFLSVCVEHFFESPRQIKENYPLLFYTTAILLNQYTLDGKTETGIREKLFEEKNKLLKPITESVITTKFKKTSSFRMLVVTAVPLFYTIGATGIASGVSLFLIIIAMLFYLRFDFYYVSARLKDKEFHLRKGLLIFKNRKRVKVPLSQLISLRLSGNKDGNSECEIIYYNSGNTFFYSETIPAGKIFSDEFLNEAIANKVAVFKG